ncbi:MAG: ribulose-phosphate 3-epimerase [Ruminococcaceae bacterium]|nr:ribulose-phosphate 3-epimerase [Oscillospiraceae bacterium]
MAERKKQISPSIMCADFMNLEKCIRDFEKNGIEYIHVDIMDGHFVPNFTLGTDFCKALKKATNIPLDIHLMVENPEEKLGWFEFGEGDYVSVHYESTKHLQRVLSEIRKRGAKPMVAINPATPIDVLRWILPDIDAVLLMTVNPGFAGQKLVEQCLEKITELRSFLDSHGCENVEIEVDGNVSFENARRMSDAGADIFIAGTSSIFKAGVSMDDSVAKLREAIK